MLFDRTSLSLCELLVWVTLRNHAEVDKAGKDPSIQVSKIETTNDCRFSISEAEERIRRAVIDGRLPCTAVRDGRRGSVVAADFMSVDFLYSTGAARDRNSGEQWNDVTFPTGRAVELWPTDGSESATMPNNQPSAPYTGRRTNAGGRPPRWDWDGFWIEVALWAAANDINEDGNCRPALTKRVTQWFADNNGGETLADSEIRSKIGALYERRRAVPR